MLRSSGAGQPDFPPPLGRARISRDNGARTDPGALADPNALQHDSADADPDIVFDHDRAGNDGRALGFVAEGAVGDGIPYAFLWVHGVEVRVGDGHVVGDHDALADGDALVAHEDGADQDRVIADFDDPAGLDIEGGPGVDANPVANDQPGSLFAAKAVEAEAALEPAIAAHLDIGGKLAVSPTRR